MDALATRGHVILDDDQVRLRTSTAMAQRFTPLFAINADESSVPKELESTAHQQMQMIAPK